MHSTSPYACYWEKEDIDRTCLKIWERAVTAHATGQSTHRNDRILTDARVEALFRPIGVQRTSLEKSDRQHPFQDGSQGWGERGRMLAPDAPTACPIFGLSEMMDRMNLHPKTKKRICINYNIYGYQKVQRVRRRAHLLPLWTCTKPFQWTCCSPSFTTYSLISTRWKAPQGLF